MLVTTQVKAETILARDGAAATRRAAACNNPSCSGNKGLGEEASESDATRAAKVVRAVSASTRTAGSNFVTKESARALILAGAVEIKVGGDMGVEVAVEKLRLKKVEKSKRLMLRLAVAVKLQLNLKSSGRRDGVKMASSCSSNQVLAVKNKRRGKRKGEKEKKKGKEGFKKQNVNRAI